MKIIRKILYILINLDVMLLGFLVGKSRRYILIGGWMGQNYADNSKALFEYLNEHNPGYKKIVFYTRNHSIYEDLKKRGYTVTYGHSLRAVYYHLKCRYHVLDNNFYCDLICALSSGSLRVYLNHGSGFKVAGNLFVPNSFPEPTFWNKITSRGCWRDCFYVASSEGEAKQLHAYFNADPKHFIYSSHPRLLPFLATKRSHGSSSFNVFYLPTFRTGKISNPLFENIESFNAFLDQNDIDFYIKPHRADRSPFPTKQFSRIHMVEASVDLYSYPVDMDLVISDYSSAPTDFLLLGKAILNFPFDLSSFLANERHMYMPYEETVPMGMVTTYPEFLEAILFIKEDPESYKKKYQNRSNVIKEFWYGKGEFDMGPLLRFLSPSKRK
jgi:CDP-glycerol glycerophosphotransferase